METRKLPKAKRTGSVSVEEALHKRRSVRTYGPGKLSIEAIAQLVWACQGVTAAGGFRATPSAGARFPLETYVAMQSGLYKYDPRMHALKQISDRDPRSELARAAWDQNFIESAPASIILCAVYGRVTSRYGERGVRYTDIEAGHAAQNVHLQAVSLGFGSCPVGAFDDAIVSRVLGTAKEEKPLYIIPVGKDGG